MSAQPITEDALLDGRVRLRQSAHGYRTAIDPVLLAAAVPAAAGETVLDIGAGPGAAALCLAARVAGCRVFGIEIARELVRLAGENVALNGLQGRVEVMAGDLTQPPPRLAPGTFDHVMANPPHFEPGRTAASPRAEKAAARIESAGGLGEWVDFALRMARPRGTLTFIHRTERLAELLALIGPKAGAIVVFPLWPDPNRARPAKRVLVRARKGLATPLRLMPGLALHEADGAYTSAAEAILRAGAALEL